MKKLIEIIALLIHNFALGKIDVAPEDRITLFNKIMGDLFNNCGAEFGTIGFWSGDEILRRLDDKIVNNIVLLNNENLVLEDFNRRINVLIVIVEPSGSFPKFAKKDSLTIQLEMIVVFVKHNSHTTLMNKIFRYFYSLFETSKFYCCKNSEEERSIDIITLNPYTAYAPSFWEKINDTIIDDYNNWSFFKSQYTEETGIIYNIELCRNIIFDRTKNLTGHTIKTLNRIRSLTKKVYFINKLITKNTDNQEINNLQLRLFEKHLIRILVKYLDVSINITYGYPGEDYSFDEFKKIRPLFYNHSADLTLTFLTKPEYRKNAETLEDLKDQSYLKIYALPSNKNYIKDPLLWNKTMFASTQYLKNIIINESVAFVSDIIHLQRFKVNKNFQVSKNLLNLGFSVLLMRHSWPLQKRVNNVIMRITQSGIMDHWYDGNQQIIERNSKMIEEEYEDYYRPIQFDDIFTFILLVLGILCALGCFICEVFIRVFTTS
ncbi:Protein of unknown function, partial [Cotesia congregata]